MNLFENMKESENIENGVVFKITDYIEFDLSWEEKQCRQLGVNFSYYQLKTAPSDEIIRKVGDADFLLVNMAKMTAEVIAGLERTKVIVRHGIGYDNLDVEAATQHGIICANQPTASSEDVAEQAIMLMLAVYRKIQIQRSILRNSIEQGKWLFDPIKPMHRMSGKTLGIVGCGNIGSIVLRKMKNFGMRILACDPYLPKERLEELGIVHTPLEEVVSEADIVTAHVPVTEETRGMFDERLLRLMKKSAVLINTSRGPIVKVNDLARVLKDGVLAGVGIDVYDTEPPTPDYSLLGMENVVLTPHLAWYSEEGGWDIRHMIMDDLKAFLEGKSPRSVLNPEVFSSPKLKMKLHKTFR
ncbi:C-terminal binding protein [Candidatus Latescibacterota bacterium]